MKERITSALIGLAVLAAIVGGLWLNSEFRLKWERKHIAAFTKGDNQYELLFRWNEVSLNPFTWSKPTSDKLIFAKRQEVAYFAESGVLHVPVIVLLNSRTLDTDPKKELARYEYLFDLRNNRIAFVANDMTGVRTEQPEYRPLEKATQDGVILEWARSAAQHQ